MTDGLNLNEITKCIKFKKHEEYPIINNINRFTQSYSIPENISVNKVNNKPQNIQQKQLIEFISNEILEIPKYFSEFINLNEYYIYGCDTILESLIYILNTDYKLENSSNKKKKLEEFYISVLEKFNFIFFKYKDFYNKHKIKRSEAEKIIKEIFLNKNNLELNKALVFCYIICNIYEYNIIIIDVDKKMYKKIYNNYEKNIILIEAANKYLPLIQIYNKILNNSDIDNILGGFNEKIDLKKISNYSLNELQEFAEKNNISILDNNKKKTKKQLYDDLTLLS
jgi:hypothetical protein